MARAPPARPGHRCPRPGRVTYHCARADNRGTHHAPDHLRQTEAQLRRKMRHMLWDIGQHANMTERVVAGQRGGGCETRTREGLPPTRFPTMRLSVHTRPGPSVTWEDRSHWVSSGRPRIPANETTNETAAESGRLTLASSNAGILLGLTRGKVARKAGRAASRRQSASGLCRGTASHRVIGMFAKNAR